MDKYKRLASNTVLFGISMFSGKIINLFLTRFFTSVLGIESYGTTENIINVLNVLMPLVSLGVIDAVSRFTLDKSLSKKDVYSSVLHTFLAGFLLFLLFYPMIAKAGLFQGYEAIIYVYIFTSILRVFTAQFVRGSLHTKLYAIDAILTSATNLGFNLLFLGVFKLGVPGFLWATIASDFVSFLFLGFSVRIWRFIRFIPVKIKLIIKMLKYSAPLIPTNMSWWLVSASASLALKESVSTAALSEYTLASRVANIISVLVNVFATSWQMSTVLDGQDEDQTRFFSKVFSTLSVAALFAGSFIILFGKFATFIMDGSRELYQMAAQYLPMLVMGAVFNCFASFFNSIYLMKKESMKTLITIAISAGISVVGNILLVGEYKAFGAAFTIMISWLALFIMRLVGTRKYVKLDINWGVFAASLVLLSAQAFLATKDVPFWHFVNLGFIVAMFVLNFKVIKEIFIFAYNATIKRYLLKK